MTYTLRHLLQGLDGLLEQANIGDDNGVVMNEPATVDPEDPPDDEQPED